MHKQRLKFPEGAAGRVVRPLVAFMLVLVSLVVGRIAEGQDKSLLWKISNDKNSVFLLGSIHYLRKENYPLNKAILEAFDGSKVLVLEIDLNSTAAEAAQRLTLEKAVYRDGTSLAQNVAPETYQLAAQRAKELGVDMRIMNPMKPWFVALTLVAIKLQSLGLDPTRESIAISRNAQKTTAKRPVDWKRSNSKLGYWINCRKPTKNRCCAKPCVNWTCWIRTSTRSCGPGRKGDVDLLAKLLLAGMKEYPEVYQKIIVERNRRWLPEIEKLIHNGSGAMLVVGAAHLVGQDGVIEMLKAKGYQRGAKVMAENKNRAKVVRVADWMTEERPGRRDFRQHRHRPAAHGKTSRQSATGARQRSIWSVSSPTAIFATPIRRA